MGKPWNAAGETQRNSYQATIARIVLAVRDATHSKLLLMRKEAICIISHAMHQTDQSPPAHGYSISLMLAHSQQKAKDGWIALSVSYSIKWVYNFLSGDFALAPKNVSFLCVSVCMVYFLQTQYNT